MTTLTALIIVILFTGPMLYALAVVIAAHLRASEPPGKREARIIKQICLRPGAWGEMKP